MIFDAHLYKFLIVVILIKSNFACTHEERYDVIEALGQQNVTKTRTVCCNGYVRSKEEHNKIICYPECKNCIQGYCLEPGKCICNDGYTGDNCTEKCAHGKWGKNCLETCNCMNGAQCDPKIGYCICATGWIGKNCEINTAKERINATNWIRVVPDAQEHDKILQNITTALNKFTESVEHLHETIADVKITNRVEEIEIVEQNQKIVEATVTIPVDLIEPAKLEAVQQEDESFEFLTVYPPLLIGLSMILIILTIFITLKIRSSIMMIRKIQINPTENFRKHINNRQGQVVVAEQSSIPTTLPIVTVTPLGSKPLIQSTIRKLPQLPDEPIYDLLTAPVAGRPISESYTTMLPLPNTETSQIKPIKAEKSFIHSKQDRPRYFNLVPGLGKINKPKSPPQQLERIYEGVQPDNETEYEVIDHYAKSK